MTASREIHKEVRCDSCGGGNACHIYQGVQLCPSCYLATVE